MNKSAGFEEFDDYRQEPRLVAAVDEAVNKISKAGNLAPPSNKSIRELIEDVEEAIAQVTIRVGHIKARLEQFNKLQQDFYKGDQK